MAQVPYRPYATVDPNGPGTPYQTANAATPDAFGASIGQALSQFGAELGANAEKMAARKNQADSTEMFVNATKELGDLDAAQGQLQGKARFDAHGDYQDKITGIWKKYSDGATNPEVKRMFDTEFRRRVAYGIVDDAKASATALRQYQNSSNTNAITLLQQDSAGVAADDQRFQTNIDNTNSIINEIGKTNDWDANKTEVARRQAVGKLWADRLKSLSISDPFRAKDLFDKNGDQIDDGILRDHVKDAIDQNVVRAGSKIDGDEIWKNTTVPGKQSMNYLQERAGKADNGKPVDIAGLHPVFANRLANAIQDAEEATGAKANIISAHRSIEEQAEIYERSGHGTKFAAAPPGQSRHQLGAAVDLGKGPVLSWIKEHASQYGLENLPDRLNDPGHIQLATADYQQLKAGKLAGVPENGTPAATAMSFFISKGLTPNQAAGLVGNLRQENDHFDPNAVHDGGTGTGIAGWNGDRRAALAAAGGEGNFQKQLEFMWQELNTTEKASLERIRSANSPEEAAVAAQGYFRPGIPQTNNRIAYAKQFASLGGTANDSSPTQGNAIQTAQNIDPRTKNDYVSPDALGKALSQVDAYAEKRFPNDPGRQAVYRDQLTSEIQRKYSTDKKVLTEQRNARSAIVMSELVPEDGKDAPTHLEQLSMNAQLAYQDMDWLQRKRVDSQLQANARRDVPVTPDVLKKYAEIKGLRTTNPDAFQNLDVADSGLPRAMQKEMINLQLSDAKKLNDTTRINAALRTVAPMLNDSGIYASRTDTDTNAKYNQFVGAFDQKLSEFEKEKQKFPNEEEQRQIAAGLLGTVAGSGWFKTDVGGRQGFEVPSQFKSQVVPDFIKNFGRPPTPRELYRLYQKNQQGQQ